MMRSSGFSRGGQELSLISQ